MFRKTLTIFSLIGLLLSLSLWVVGFWGLEVRSPDHSVGAGVGGGGLTFGRWAVHYEPVPSTGAPWIEWTWHGYEGFKMAWWPRANFKELHSSFCTFWWAIKIPLWIPTLLCGLVLGLTGRCNRLLKKRVLLGLCMNCGYDLRGSKERCPECGRSIVVARSRAVS